MELGLVKRIEVTSEEFDNLATPYNAQFDENSYLILKSEDKSTLVRFADNKLHLLSKKKIPLQGKDAAQCAYIDSLLSDYPMTVCLGPAGTGKTLLALSYAFEAAKRKRIYLSKPTTLIGKGKAFGACPGGVAEKYAPFLDSYYIVFEKILGPQYRSLVDLMIKKEDLKFIPIEYARGCTYENCTFILDEAQGLSTHELFSILTRIGSGSKLIVLGDFNQIDTGDRPEQTGLFRMLHSRTFRESPLKSTIQLTQQYRSPITELINNVDKELREKGTRYS